MEHAYNADVEALRDKEFPHMSNGVYLDHSGSTIYAKSTVESFSRKMMTNLYGNPHSENSPAKTSGHVVDQVREKTLKFLGASPEHFDLVFVANATAAIKLVAESFRDLAERTKARRFWYGFHKDTLLDAAALAMTSSMSHVFRDVDRAPDFTCLSLYKIFGFPDLGALVVRKQSGHILTLRRYFGGGTVTMVSTFGEVWHRSKGLQGPTYQLHEGLEDGTLPFHSILALGEAIDVHKRLFTSMNTISSHATYLIYRLYRGISSLRHGNGRPVCRVYSENGFAYDDAAKQGSVLAFNILRANGSFVPYSDVETQANDAGIYIRSGGVCNPGGIFSALGYEPWMTERALSAGHHCGSHGISVIHRLPTGIVRASVGAMSTKQDVDALVDFLRATFIETTEMELEDEDWSGTTTTNNSGRNTLYAPSEVYPFDLSKPRQFPDRPLCHHFPTSPAALPQKFQGVHVR